MPSFNFRLQVKLPGIDPNGGVLKCRGDVWMGLPKLPEDFGELDDLHIETTAGQGISDIIAFYKGD